ncbi:hypothetical protein Athai_17620 [Actinocatenispora thailandica]|uniref:Uncharacterized protein n=1 Tax=Actinocatenispora thailandica TaxID=227318 RepID=A0A7R7DM58_9ACTN|nr:hypothetical protein Athai_17620 [Actinocatenispora thailandica]
MQPGVTAPRKPPGDGEAEGGADRVERHGRDEPAAARHDGAPRHHLRQTDEHRTTPRETSGSCRPGGSGARFGPGAGAMASPIEPNYDNVM